jgi:ribosomal protein S18 acetylase RimI-like enzyme
MEQTFTLRLAESNDIDALTELHWESFRPEEHIPVMLGRRYVRAAYKWQVNSEQAYTLIAEADRKIVGLVAVCDGPFTLPMFKACVGEFVRSLVKTPSLLLKKKLWARLFRRPDVSRNSRKIADYPGFAQMTIGAVDANYRGNNVFPALVEATKTISKSRGSRAIRAGVYKNNTPSRRVFIKGGWIETPELETKDTVFYVAYLDPKFPDEIGIKLPNHI